MAVPLGVLVGEELDQGLRDREAGASSERSSGVSCGRFVEGEAGSTGWPGQVERIQPWSGWSQISHSRAPGPAITFR